MRAKALWIHDCELPKMKTVTEVDVTYRNWLGMTKVRKETRVEYDTRHIVFTCPECGTVRQWVARFWTVTYRPQVWKSVDL